MKKEQLIKAGVNVLSEFHNEHTGDHWFLVEDHDGYLMTVHSYISKLDNVPIVELYLKHAFTRHIVNFAYNWSEIEPGFFDALKRYARELEDGEIRRRQ